MMTPLKPGDEIRIIAPSRSQGSGRSRQYERAQERLEALGYKLTFSNYIKSKFHIGTAAAEQRAEDFNGAFADKNVKAVMAIHGGWSANEILPLIDWQVVAANPKPLFGFSDITVLLNGIYAKTGNVGYLAPNFATLGSMTSWQYTLENLNNVLTQQSPLILTKSKEWGASKSARFNTKAWKVLSEGEAEATLLGGNLGTLYLLQGTEYQPKFDKPFIFALEDDDEAGKYTAREVSRRFESLLQLPNFRKNLRGVIIGRFPPDSKVMPSEIKSIVDSKRLGDIPVIAGIDYGHTLPMLTLPIGGTVKLVANQKITLTI